MSNTARPLRVAMVIDDFYPASGGISRSVENQIKELTRLGHHLTLVAPRHHLQKPTYCNLIVAPSFYIPPTPSHMCVIRHSRSYARQISRDHRFDIVHSQTERGALILAANLARHQNIPHIHTFHANLAGTHTSQPIISFLGSMAYLFLVIPNLALASRGRIKYSKKSTMPRKSAVSRLIERIDWRSLAMIATRVDAFVTPSYFMKAYIESCLPGEDTGRVIPNGIDDDHSTRGGETSMKPAEPDLTSLRFLSIGRLSKEKRVDAIIEAFILADIDGSELHIVGSGDQLPALQRLSRLSDKKIFFHSHLTDSRQVAQMYLNSDVFILASYHFDNQPMTIVEAAATGLPIIYCDERLDVGLTRSNSILSNSPNPRDIATAMKDMTDTEKRLELSLGSIQVAKNLRASTMAEQYVKIYRQLISKSKE